MSTSVGEISLDLNVNASKTLKELEAKAAALEKELQGKLDATSKKSADALGARLGKSLDTSTSKLVKKAGTLGEAISKAMNGRLGDIGFGIKEKFKDAAFYASQKAKDAGAALKGRLASGATAAKAAMVGLGASLASFAKLGAALAFAAAAAGAALLSMGYAFIASEAGAEKPIAAFDRFNQTAQVLQQRMAELGAAVRAALTSAFLPFAQTVQAVALKVVNAVTNAVMAIGKAISFVTGVDFGEVLSQYADREADIALNGTSAAGAISDQAAAQKELNKTLASFDKINRLSSDTPSSGGGGSSFVPDAGAAAAWQSFKNSAMSALDNIKLPDRLLKSLENLKTRFGELSETISGGLKLAYDNVLKPLADWTWEVVVPEGIDLIADALGHLNTFFQQISDPMSRLLTMLSDLAKWLWTDILQPLGDWATNSVLPRVLEAIGKAFDIIVTVLGKLRPIAEFLWKEIIQPIAAFLGDVFVAALNVVNIALGALLDIIKQADFTEFVANLKAVKDWLAEKLAIAFGVVSDAAKWLWDNVLVPFGDFLKDVFEGKVEAVNVVVGLFADAWNAVKGAAQWLWDNLLKPFGNFLGDVFTGKVEIVNKVVEAFAAAWTAVKDAAKWLWDNILKPIADFFTGVFKKAIKGVTDLLSGDNALSGAFDVLSGAGKFVMDNVFKPLGDFFANIFPGDVGKSEEKVKDLSEVWNELEEEKRLKVSVDEPKTVINTGEKSKFQKFMEEQFPDRDVKFTVSPGTSPKDILLGYTPLAKEWKPKESNFTVDASKTSESYIGKLYAERSGEWSNKTSIFSIDPTKTPTQNIKNEFDTRRKIWENRKANFTVGAGEDNGGTKLSSLRTAYNDRTSIWAPYKTPFTIGAGEDNGGTKISNLQGAWDDRKKIWKPYKTPFTIGAGENNGGTKISNLKGAWDDRKDVWAPYKTPFTIGAGENNGGTKISNLRSAYNDRTKVWAPYKTPFTIEKGTTEGTVKGWNDGLQSKWFGKDADYLARDVTDWKQFKTDANWYRDQWYGTEAKFSAVFEDGKFKEDYNAFARKVNERIANRPLYSLVGVDMTGLELPFLAKGGYVPRNTPHLAVIGDNRVEGEIVAPESKMQAMADRAAANASNQRVESLLVELIDAVRSQDTATYLDGQQIARSTVGYINQQTQQTGACPILV